MTYSQFKAEVRSWLPLDANRVGAQAFIDKNILAALVELQQHVMTLRTGVESLYRAENMVIEGDAARGLLPSRTSHIRAAWMITMENDEEVSRNELTLVPWSQRAELISGLVENAYLISPYRDSFYVSPVLEATNVLSLAWDGPVLKYEDNDTAPAFDDPRVVQACGYFVKAELARTSDNDLQSSLLFKADFVRIKTALYLEHK